MKSKSRKAKGRRLQNLIAESLLRLAPQLHDDDIRPALMGEAGEDIKLSPAARRLYPFSFEAKNTERLQLWAAVEQARTNTPDGACPITVVARNHTPPLAVMDYHTLEYFLRLHLDKVVKSGD